jgi:type I restriction enzyme, S subunit
MPAEWKSLALLDAGVSLIDCEHRTPPAAAAGFPYVAIPQLKAGRLDLSNARQITTDHFREWTRKARPETHDVILSRRCNPGETAFVPPGLQCALGQNLVLLRADGTKVYPPFLRWLVRGEEWWEQIRKFLNSGAVFDSLKCADIPHFQLPIPPLEEQEAIAAALGALDQKIDLNGRMNETLEAIARAMFKSYFLDSESSAEWRRANLSDVCEYIMSGGTPSTKDTAYWNGKIPWLSSGETRNHFICRTDKRITQAGVENSSTRFARRGCTVIASAGQGHTRGQTSLLMMDSYINQSVIALAANSRVVSDSYLYFDLERRYAEFRRISDSQSSRGSLTTKLLGNLPVIVPPRELIAKFEDTTKPLVERIRVSVEEGLVLTSLRDTLLPKLLSGEIRVTPNLHISSYGSGKD